jgi:hypothetical protein
VKVATVRTAGRVLLAATAAFAVVVAFLAYAAGGNSILYLAFLAAFVAWPLGSLFAERAGQVGLAWGLLALYALEAIWLGLSWGGLLMYGLPTYAVGLFFLRWARRGAQPNA